MGLSKGATDRLFEPVVEFSELGEFIDVPLRQYSTGMRARLGFSLVAHTQPDILLLDEVLSVGDAGFRQKSQAKMLEVIELEGEALLMQVPGAVHLRSEDALEPFPGLIAEQRVVALSSK